MRFALVTSTSLALIVAFLHGLHVHRKVSMVTHHFSVYGMASSARGSQTNTMLNVWEKNEAEWKSETHTEVICERGCCCWPKATTGEQHYWLIIVQRKKESEKRERSVAQDCKNGLHPLAIYIKRQIVFWGSHSWSCNHQCFLSRTGNQTIQALSPVCPGESLCVCVCVCVYG